MTRRLRAASIAATAVLLTGLLGPASAQGRGDLIVFFEIAPTQGGEKADVDIDMQRVTPGGKLLWGQDGDPVALASSDDIESLPAACDDGAGGAIVAYVYEFMQGEHQGDADIVAQRIDQNGKLLWHDGQSPVQVAGSKHRESHPVVVSDGQGGAIVVYEWTGDKGGKVDTDLLVQRIDGSGKRLWNDGEKPTVVASSDGKERAPAVVPDGEGGVIVVFEWEGADNDLDIMAQRISADGKELWNEGKQATDVASSDALERHPVAVPDGRGGAIAVFELEYTNGERKGDVDIHAQRISADGVLLWNGGEKPAELSTATAVERNPSAIPDGAGGVIAAFELESVEGEDAGDTGIFAQRLDSNGKWLWNNGKRSAHVSRGAALERAVKIVPAADGGALCVFEAEYRTGEHAGDIDILAQRLSPAGEWLWNEGKRSSTVAASKWLERSPLVVADGEGGAIVIYAATGPPGDHEGDVDLEAMRLSAEGEMMWNEGKQAVDIAAGKGLERNPCVVVVGER